MGLISGSAVIMRLISLMRQVSDHGTTDDVQYNAMSVHDGMMWLLKMLTMTTT